MRYIAQTIQRCLEHPGDCMAPVAATAANSTILWADASSAGAASGGAAAPGLAAGVAEESADVGGDGSGAEEAAAEMEELVGGGVLAHEPEVCQQGEEGVGTAAAGPSRLPTGAAEPAGLCDRQAAAGLSGTVEQVAKQVHRVLFLISTYVIGKERILFAVSCRSDQLPPPCAPC